MAQRQTEGASNRTINLELEVLSRAMGHKWSVMWPNVAKLEENKDAGSAPEPEEEKAVMDAAKRNRSPLIYPYLMILAWTGMRDSEGRFLRWEQIDFEAGQVLVGRSKMEKGTHRVIPMSGPAAGGAGATPSPVRQMVRTQLGAERMQIVKPVLYPGLLAYGPPGGLEDGLGSMGLRRFE
jgi:hypothetical protein